MATDKQIEANRLNAQKSSGPRSAEGKARSRFNALKSGIDADSLVLPGEDPAAVESLRAEYYDHYQPATPGERDTLDAVVHAVCLMRRFRRVEAQLFRHEMAAIPDLDPSAPIGHVFSQASRKFVYLQSRMNSVERSFQRNQDRLERLQSQRPPAEPEPQAEPEPESAPPPPQPAETAPETPKLAWFSKEPAIPGHRSANPAECPFCRKVGRTIQLCTYPRESHGEPLTGHALCLVDTAPSQTPSHKEPQEEARQE